MILAFSLILYLFKISKIVIVKNDKKTINPGNLEEVKKAENKAKRIKEI